jgi:hypothetical protein
MEFLVDEALEEELQQSSDPRVHLIAGACAGLMEHCGMFPIDTVKALPLSSSLSILNIYRLDLTKFNFVNADNDDFFNTIFVTSHLFPPPQQLRRPTSSSLDLERAWSPRSGPSSPRTVPPASSEYARVLFFSSWRRWAPRVCCLVWIGVADVGV